MMISIFLLLIRLDEGDHWGCFYSRSANVGAEAPHAETLLKATQKESGRKKAHSPGLLPLPGAQPLAGAPHPSHGAWTCSGFDKGPWAFQSSKEVASAPAAGLGQRRAHVLPDAGVGVRSGPPWAQYTARAPSGAGKRIVRRKK